MPVELDSNANTCCAGLNCTMVKYTGKVCNIVGFNWSSPDKLTGIPIVKAAMAYNAPNGETVIIILSQALYLGNMLNYTLLCPNQLRCNRLIVDDVPRQLSPDPQKATHSIFVPVEHFRIPLEMRGVRNRVLQMAHVYSWVRMVSALWWVHAEWTRTITYRYVNEPASIYDGYSYCCGCVIRNGWVTI